jgi:uncharacterized protein YxjI
MQGKQLAFIRQKLLAWGPTYEIYNQDRLRAIVKKSLFTFLYSKFSVDVRGPDDLEVTGGFSAHEYTFERRGEVVATVSKQWFTWTDTYGVEIVEDQDDVLILAVTVVIDMASHKKKN